MGHERPILRFSKWDMPTGGRSLFVRVALECVVVSGFFVAALYYIQDRLVRGCGPKSCTPASAIPSDVAWRYSPFYALAITLGIVGLRILMACAEGRGPQRRTAVLLGLGFLTIAAGAAVGWLTWVCSATTCADSTGSVAAAVLGGFSGVAGLVCAWFWVPGRRSAPKSLVR